MLTLQSVLTSLVFMLMPAQTTLYSSSLEEVVVLPAGYFVLKSDEYAPDGYTAVIYDDISGYVKTDAVTTVDYIPVTKYEKKVKFSCDNDGQPVNLRAAPNKSSNVLTVLGSADTGRCYGSVRGEALISGAGDTWYYVSVDNFHGYCYYAHVTVDPTPPNVIEKEEQVKPVTATPQDPEPEQSMSATAAIIFIVALCIPVPFVMYFLFKKPKDENK